MAKSFGDYLASAGYFLLDTTREAVLRHDDETVQQEHVAGISILTAALYEAKIKAPEIVRLLQKYYGLREVQKICKGYNYNRSSVSNDYGYARWN